MFKALITSVKRAIWGTPARSSGESRFLGSYVEGYGSEEIIQFLNAEYTLMCQGRRYMTIEI
ncbi:hypothetical protein IJG10_00460, partial [Candidatus Saccharibacteria bacterium]|nr:hypothetical protein [Candidatus Saccharibacteria bacterium]